MTQGIASLLPVQLEAIISRRYCILARLSDSDSVSRPDVLHLFPIDLSAFLFSVTVTVLPPFPSLR